WTSESGERVQSITVHGSGRRAGRNIAPATGHCPHRVLASLLFLHHPGAVAILRSRRGDFRSQASLFCSAHRQARYGVVRSCYPPWKTWGKRVIFCLTIVQL